MLTKSTAPTTPKTTRVERGITLYLSRGHEIRHVKGTVFSVPSCSCTGVYLVDLLSGVCTCPDMPPADEVCKHVHAATIANAKTTSCSGCGDRFPRSGLIELFEDNHDNLTYFHGDLLCEECAGNAGIL